MILTKGHPLKLGGLRYEERHWRPRFHDRKHRCDGGPLTAARLAEFASSSAPTHHRARPLPCMAQPVTRSWAMGPSPRSLSSSSATARSWPWMPHQSLLRPARRLRQAAPSARRLHSARRYSVEARRGKRPGEARPFLGFPPLAQPPGAFAPEEVSQWGRYSSAGAESLSAQRDLRDQCARKRRQRPPLHEPATPGSGSAGLRGQRWVTVLVPIRPVRPRVVTANVITPRPTAKLGRLPILVVLDLPVVAPDHTEQISHGPLTFKDRMALPPISVRYVSTTCTVPSCPYRSMHAVDEL